MNRIIDPQLALDLVNKPEIRALLAAQSTCPGATADHPQELSSEVEFSHSDDSAAVGETNEDLTWKPLHDFDEAFNIIPDKGVDYPDEFPEECEDKETDEEIRAILARSNTR